jgi:NAD(P)-dependent dehydrogenase (short-subunit alcohol dehydrogenase family)
MGAYLVTGAAGHLGRAVVQRLAGEGLAVVAAVSPNHKKARAVRPEIESHAVDALDEKAVRSLLQQIARRHRTLDGLVACVGGFAGGSIAKTDLGAMEKMIRLNFHTAYTFARHALAQMKKQPLGGRMVFIGSKPALQPAEGAGAAAYTVSKAMLLTLAGLVNAYAEGPRVTASVLAPGTLDTPPNRKSMPKADFSKWVPTAEAAALIHELVTGRFPAWREPVVKLYGG